LGHVPSVQTPGWQRRTRPILATLAFAALLAPGTAWASEVFADVLADEYIMPEGVDWQQACLYCHRTLDGVIVNGKSFSLYLRDERGLEKEQVEQLRTIINELGAALVAVPDPLAEGTGLLDTDKDGIPDALEIRWGSNPSDAVSILEPDPAGGYQVLGPEFVPIKYGCGARIAPAAPAGAPERFHPLWLLALVVALRAGRRTMRRHKLR
jgi:hypothetical protein